MNVIDKEIYVRPGQSVELFRDTGLTVPYMTIGPEGFIGVARGLKGNVLLVQRPEGSFFLYTAGGDINNHPRFFASDLPAGSVPEVVDTAINTQSAVFSPLVVFGIVGGLLLLLNKPKRKRNGR